MTPSTADLVRELVQLREQNAELSNQLTELVRVSTRMHRLRATLEDRQRLYGALAQFLGEQLPSAADAEAVAACATTFVAYEMGFERVLLVADCLESTCHQGFWDDEELPSQVLARHNPRSSRLCVHTEAEPSYVLADVAADLGLVEFAYLPLCGTKGAIFGWLGFGSTAAGRTTSTRITGKDADHVDVARSLASAVAAALENRLRESEMVIQVERAEAANHAKSRFVANMTHELRTPLNAIIGYTELIGEILEERGLGREFDHDQSRVLLASRRLLHLVDDVLDLARVEAGTMLVESESFDVDEVVAQVVAELAPAAAGRGNQLQHTVLNDTPSPTMLSDAARVRQILSNLLTNANKFTEDGRVTVTAILDCHWVTFEVSDSGIGMSEDALERIFRPFEQADNSTTRRFGGTGLGLHITEQLVTLLGGTIEAHSQLGEGSMFRVTLPRARDLGRTTPPGAEG